MVVQTKLTMKNLNKISAGLKSLCSSEASAIIEELQTPEQIMCINAVHMNMFGIANSYEYSWQVPQDLWGKVEVGDFVEVENCNGLATVQVISIFWLNPEDAAYHSSVLSIDHYRLSEPIIYFNNFIPVFCWYKNEIPETKTLYTLPELYHFYKEQVEKNIISLFGFWYLTEACLEGCLNFLNQHAPWLGYQACYETQNCYNWEEAMDETEFIYKPFVVTEEFIEKIQEAGYLK